MFVPSIVRPTDKNVLKKFLRAIQDVEKLVVITGAGISTESGIPDYRSEKVGLYARSNHKPMLHQNFMKSASNRQRYWARNLLAWPRFSQAKPNDTHYTLAAWERSDRFQWLITQNVDNLHTRAGSEKVTELHGCSHFIKCMNCGDKTARSEFQARLESLNPTWMTDASPGEMAPDGDVFIPDGTEKDFVVPECDKCGGILKTDVVFFGDNVPRKIVDQCYDEIDNSDGLLVLGSSLEVMSSYRYVYHASLKEIPIFIVNVGPTRGDHLATHKIEALCSEIVKQI